MQLLCCLTLFFAFCSAVQAQELLKAIDPGTGYSRMKQWPIEHGLLFENFTKDSLVITGRFKESDDRVPYTIQILSRFCAGDDYTGRAFNTTLQQSAEGPPPVELRDVFTKHRKYIDFLAGKSSEDGRFSGDYKLRRERASEDKGIAVGTTSDQGSWEVGLFAHRSSLVIQVVRAKNELCS